MNIFDTDELKLIRLCWYYKVIKSMFCGAKSAICCTICVRVQTNVWKE